VGEARPDERKIDIPGAERTAVTDFGAQQPHDDGSGLLTAASGGNINSERPVIRWMSAIDKNRNEIVQQLDPGEPPIRNALKKLFAEHQGKVSEKWSMYLDVYPRLFEPFRNTPVRLLEIGVQNGGSLEIWRKYFPRSRVIVGCDINPDCSKLRFEDDAIKLIVRDANSDEIHSKIATCSAEYDIIIGDGSHMSSDIVRSFAQYFGNLTEGGLYVVEDLHCSYWKNFEGGPYDPYSSMSFFKRLLDVVNKEHWRLPHDRVEALAAFSRKYSVTFDEPVLASVHSVEFINSLAILRKLAAPENDLGSREIVGCDAPILDVRSPLNGAPSQTSDETTNPWSLGSTPAEEEIEANRKLVESQQWQ
jgi:O-antigen biosynthesis protein